MADRREAGSESIMMGELAEPARANFLLLLASGLVMVLTLFFSKKSQHVTETGAVARLAARG